MARLKRTEAGVTNQAENLKNIDFTGGKNSSTARLTVCSILAYGVSCEGLEREPRESLALRPVLI